MRLTTKLATAVGAMGLAATGALAAFSSSPAATHIPAVINLTATHQAVPSQVAPTAAPAPPPNNSTVDTPGAETPETGAEATTAEPANEVQLPGGGRADASGANVDNQFEGVQ